MRMDNLPDSVPIYMNKFLVKNVHFSYPYEREVEKRKDTLIDVKNVCPFKKTGIEH